MKFSAPLLATSLAAVLVGVIAQVANAANEQYAVVRIPSHGASATVIDTAQGYSWILGCGHAYQGSSRNKPMVFDICRANQGPPKQVGSKLVFLDYEADLSLVLLNDGPLEYVSPVAPRGFNPSGDNILSCGFDKMEFPMHQVPTTILSDEGGTWYTREKPWHGRSGGGLIDITKGQLIGTCQGYETPYSSPSRRGMYVDLATIHNFLDRYRAKHNAQQNQQQQPLQPIWQPERQYFRPQPCPGGG